MEFTKETTLNYDDITIVPEGLTLIKSRKECQCRDSKDMLPIFTAPMSNVVDLANIDTFSKNGIIPIIPRNISIATRLFLLKYTEDWVAISLNEARQFLSDGDFFYNWHSGEQKIRVCIDLANGHMNELIETIRSLKGLYGDSIEIMSGNIANPEAYILYEDAGCDYVRCGIGGGSACTTSTCVGVHMAMFSLIKSVYKVKKNINGKCKIIADGGIKKYRDIQKALLYADYVMIGGMLNRCLESAASTKYGKFYFNFNGFKILRPIKTIIKYGKNVKFSSEKQKERLVGKLNKGKVELWKEFYGMSTERSQIEFSQNKNVEKKTSEGCIFKQKVEYTISEWAKKEEDYLRSAMSYTNSRNLSEYKDSLWARITRPMYNN